jgi:FkbM family methyltransferase
VFAHGSVGTVTAALHKTFARSRSAVHVAVKVRNQCNAIIASSVNEGSRFDRNGELWAIEQIAPHSRFFVDVGANIGNWAQAFATRMPGEPQGLLIEPSPEAAAALRSWIERAGLSKLEIVQAAASDRVGSCSFFIEPGAGEMSSFLAEHSSPQAQRIMVCTTTLDDELQERNVSSIDFLKIDAEGYDLHVLRGAAKYIQEQRISVIQFEYNSPWQLVGSTLRSAYELLEDSGYQVYLLKKKGLFEFRPETFGEFYASSNFIAYCLTDVTQGLAASVKQKL